MVAVAVTAAGAYPRACGATKEQISEQINEQGLSPRVRGNRVPGCLAQPARGPIPARAGQPDIARRARRNSGAYPRACGATSHCGWPPDSPQGLSPRVRGNHGLSGVRRLQRGPIPARAGQPPPRSSRPLATGAYPRACGATKTVGCLICGSWGLSPRVRGNLRQRTSAAAPVGPIPARAGQPPRSTHLRRPWRAYPRACGATARLKSAKVQT